WLSQAARPKAVTEVNNTILSHDFFIFCSSLGIVCGRGRRCVFTLLVIAQTVMKQQPVNDLKIQVSLKIIL
ncbi:MAG: hypothetical protein R3311_17745, partial [Oceanisphaera sp.]|nr:hypothetical protein [Oceanisphaera sp.]